MPRKKPEEKPKIGLPDALEAAQATAKAWQEGSHKLARAVDALRQGLETIVQAEMDNSTGLPVSANDLRGLAVTTLDAYSRITGQAWRKHRVIESWASGTGNKPVHENQM
jgi:hypothetical protein